MTAAERRRLNRARVVRLRLEPPRKTPDTLRSDGLTGAEILEIWKHRGKITEGR